MKKVVYYEDELNDEFSKAKINPILIDENYKYNHSFLWDFCSFLVQNVFSMPIKILYVKWKFKIKFIGKDKLKKYNKPGYFIYGNHTQDIADTIIPSLLVYPKRNFFIVNPENVSMKGLKTVTEMLGALPIPHNFSGMKNFMDVVSEKIHKNYSITIYPEAHIWPYYTKIRNFKSVSFKYPIEHEKPTFCFTNTYQSFGKNNDKVKIVTYIDGPFWPDKSLSKKQSQLKLRNEIYNTMVQRSLNSNIDVIEYKQKEHTH